MRTLRHVLESKGREIVAVPPDATAQEAARVMTHSGVGAVLVTGPEGLVGIFTERDALRRIVCPALPPGEIRVGDVMSEVVRAELDDSVLDAMRVMTERRTRHLAVGGFAAIVGVVSIGDLAKCAAQDLDRELAEMTEFIAGPGARHDSDWPLAFPRQASDDVEGETPGQREEAGSTESVDDTGPAARRVP